jgi:hypothetical protein
MKYAIVLLLGWFAFGWTQESAAQMDSLKKQIEQLQQRIQKIEAKSQQEELQKLREAALQAAQTGAKKSKEIELKSFKEGSRSLQALNPEISVTGDMLVQHLVEAPHYRGGERSGFQFRVLGLHFQSNLDPFSFIKVAVGLSPAGIGLGEAYATWINALPRVNLTLGKFRQQFGVVNRWHQHSLDQSTFPLPIQLYMGKSGLNQIGLSLNWLMPSLTAHANELTLEVTNAQNSTLFSGNEFGLPATLLHWKNYYDLNRDTYFEWGLTGLAGTNDSLGLSFDPEHRWTVMAGLDLTLSWTPVNKALYRGMTWRTELFYVNKELSHNRTITALGGYSYVDYRLSQRFVGGVRVDVAQPPMPENTDKILWQVVPYLTFWQSEFVLFRLEFRHMDGSDLEQADNRVLLQIDWAAGPHKHERY